jgi:hypothetical protein
MTFRFDLDLRMAATTDLNSVAPSRFFHAVTVPAVIADADAE